MKWLLMCVFLLTSCKSHIPKEYRKLQRRIDRNERRQSKEDFIRSLENDTIRVNWIEFLDSSLIGLPKFISVDTLKDKK